MYVERFLHVRVFLLIFLDSGVERNTSSHCSGWQQDWSCGEWPACCFTRDSRNYSSVRLGMWLCRMLCKAKFPHYWCLQGAVSPSQNPL